MSSEESLLNILIVGAGLAGLAAGLALQTDGLSVTIVDSVADFAEVSELFYSVNWYSTAFTLETLLCTVYVNYWIYEFVFVAIVLCSWQELRSYSWKFP